MPSRRDALRALAATPVALQGCGSPDAVGPRRAAEAGAVFDVQRYGATGDGVTNDSPGVDRAVAAARAAERGVVYFPPGTYRLSNPVDLTAGARLSLRGAGVESTILWGMTGSGGCVVDMVGARYAGVSDLSIHTTGARGSSTVGILFTRLATLAQAGGSTFVNVRTYMHTDARANGGAGTVGMYNVCAEANSWLNCEFRGDTAMLLSAANLFGLRSRGQEVQRSDSSMTVANFYGGGLIGLAGPALRLHGGANAIFHCHLTSQSHEVELRQGAYPYAVRVTSDWTDFTFAGGMEAMRTLMNVDGCVVTGLVLRAYQAVSTGAFGVYLTGPASSVVGGTIEFIATPDTAGVSGYLVDSDARYEHAVRNVEIRLHRHRMRIQNSFASSAIDGCVIHSTSTLAETRVGAPGRNLVIARDGVDYSGARIIGSFPTAARPSAAAAGAGAQYYDRTRGIPVWSDGAAWRDALGRPV